MKEIPTLLVVLFLATFASTQKLAAPGSSCPNNNPFIISPMKDVELYKAPVAVDFICNFEFGKYGTCCNPWNLESFARNEAIYLQNDVQRLNKEYAHFQDLIKNLYRTLKRIALAPSHPTRQDWNTKIKLAQKAFNDPVVNTYFKQQLAIGTTAISTFQEQNSACWRMQSRARDLALCFTCSGRSNHFFRNKKALIGQNTCSTFIQNCAAPLSTLVTFVRSLEFLPMIDAKLKEFDLYLNVDAKLKVSEVKKYFQIFRAENIEELVQTSSKTPSAAVQAQMCAKFLRLKETPIVSQMRPMFSSDGPWSIQLWDIRKHLEANAAQIDAKEKAYDSQYPITGTSQPTTNWKISQRLLQFGGSPLESDASIILPTDPSYTSVGVSGNSPMEFGYSFP